MAKKSSKQKFKQLVLDSCSCDPPLLKKRCTSQKCIRIFTTQKNIGYKNIQNQIHWNYAISRGPISPHVYRALLQGSPWPTQSDSRPVFYLYIRPRHVEHARPVLAHGKIRKNITLKKVLSKSGEHWNFSSPTVVMLPKPLWSPCSSGKVLFRISKTQQKLNITDLDITVSGGFASPKWTFFVHSFFFSRNKNVNSPFIKYFHFLGWKKNPQVQSIVLYLTNKQSSKKNRLKLLLEIFNL